MKYRIGILLIIGYSLSIYGQNDSITFYYEQAKKFKSEQSLEGYLENIQKANRLRPHHPTLLYHLAAAQALSQNMNSTYETLEQLLLMNAEISIEEEEDFKLFRETERYTQLLELQEKLKKSVDHGVDFMKISQGQFHPEGIAFHKNSHQIFLGGVHERAVTSISYEGIAHTLIDYEADTAIYSVMGLEVDLKNNRLWFCTAVLPQMKEYNSKLDGYSSLFELDLASGKLLTRIIAKNGNTFGDLIISEDGTVYISDGAANTIYTARSGDTEFRVWKDLRGYFRNLQGMAFADASTLICSDYVSGLYRIDVKTKQFEKINFEPAIPWKGIDGLYYYKKTIIAIENGSNPMRVVQYELNKKLNKVVSYKTLVQNVESLNEPTQGYLNKSRFIFLSNSPWRFYENNQPDRAKIQPTLLKEIQLK